MTPRENLLRVLAFDHPEYVPHGLPVHWLRYRGANHQSLDGTGGDDSPAGSRWTDIWGVGWHKELDGVMGLPEGNPLADITKVDSYPFPDPRDPRIVAGLHGPRPEFDREQAFLGGAHRDTLFEQAYMLVGMENLFIAFHEEPNAVCALFRRITDFHLGLAEQYVALGVEWASLGDDLGHQLGLLFSRETLEEFFLPEYRRVFGFYEERGVRVNFHSCGRVQDLADVLIGLGVDVLNPVQASANDLPLLRARTHGRLTLMGGVPSHVVYEGPPARIRAEVGEKIALLGRSGGYICTPDQGLPFPPEHIEAFRAAVEEFGYHPSA
jgi:uroporphyrinogen decarboxylase